MILRTGSCVATAPPRLHTVAVILYYSFLFYIFFSLGWFSFERPHLLDSLGLTRQVHFAQEWRQESINQILCFAFFFSRSLSEVRTGEGRAGSHHSLQGCLCVLSQVKHFFSTCVSQTTGVGGSWLWLLLFKTFNVQLNDGHRLAALFSAFIAQTTEGYI